MRRVLTYTWMVSHDGHAILFTEHLVGRHVLLFWLVPRENRTGKSALERTLSDPESWLQNRNETCTLSSREEF